MQPSSDDNRIHGFDTLVLPVCRIRSLYLASVLTQVCRLWRCFSSPSNSIKHSSWTVVACTNPLPAQNTLHMTRDKTFLVRNIGRIPPSRHSSNSTLLFRLRLVVRVIPGDSYNVLISRYLQRIWCFITYHFHPPNNPWYSSYVVEQEVQGFPIKRCTALMQRNILACSPSHIF